MADITPHIKESRHRSTERKRESGTLTGLYIIRDMAVNCYPRWFLYTCVLSGLKDSIIDNRLLFLVKYYFKFFNPANIFQLNKFVFHLRMPSPHSLLKSKSPWQPTDLSLLLIRRAAWVKFSVEFVFHRGHNFFKVSRIPRDEFHRFDCSTRDLVISAWPWSRAWFRQVLCFI